MAQAVNMATMAAERCDVWELARRGGQVQGELALASSERLAEALFDTAGTLRYRFSGMTDARGRAAATLEIDGQLSARCDRCGAAVDVPIRERATFYFVADERELARLPIDEAPEEALLGSPRFDLTALVEDQAILALPISPRHETCAMPALADEPSAVEKGPAHRPFESLAVLRKRRQ